MMPNPAFAQWRAQKAAWDAENTRRRTQFLGACHMVRHDVQTGYKVDIEADSTIAPDEQAEKAARTEFLQAIMPMLQMIIPEVQQNPAVAPLAMALVMFGVRAFPAARGLEPMFEQAFRTLAQSPPTPNPQQQQRGNTKSPMEIMTEARTAQGDQQIDQAKVQAQQQANAVQLMKAYIEAQGDAKKLQQEGMLHMAEIQQQGQEIQQRAQLEQARTSHLLSRDIGGLV
jgi:short subunit dehydrogenase-like uncharacterized protein